MEKLLLVDGSNLLFQMFFGMPSRILNGSGRAIHGTMGFVGALLKIVRLTEPTHLAVLFDGEHENARAALDPAYKANRPDYSQVAAEEDPFSQLPDVYAALDFLAVRHAETVDCETDDWIAGYAYAHGERAKVVISSFDSDYFQLLSRNVSVLRYRGRNTVVCTPEFLEERYGVLPSRYADFKALTGDSADNIKGADKVGPKTAAQLLERFGSLENLLEHADEIERPIVREAICTATERLRRNYRLIKLAPWPQLPFDWDEMTRPASFPSTTETLRGIGLLP